MAEETTTGPPPAPVSPPPETVAPPIEYPPEVSGMYPGRRGEEPALNLEKLISAKKGQPMDIGSAYIFGKMIREDRRDRREDLDWRAKREERERGGKGGNIDIGEVIGKAVKEAVEPLVEKVKPKSTEEIPPWAKDMQSQNKQILDRFEKEDQEKHDRTLIESVKGPLEKQIGELQTELGRISTPAPLAPSSSDKPKGILADYLRTRNELKEAGLLQETPPGTVILGGEGTQGIKVSGSIPAWVVYGPKVADDILEMADKRIDGIIAKIMLAGAGAGDKKKKAEKDLIEIPRRPAPPRPYPPLTSADQPPTPTPTPPPTPPPETTAPTLEPEELVEIPPRPTPPPETEAEKEPEPEVEPEPAISKIEYKRGFPGEPTPLEETPVEVEAPPQPSGTTQEAMTTLPIEVEEPIAEVVTEETLGVVEEEPEEPEEKKAASAPVELTEKPEDKEPHRKKQQRTVDKEQPPSYTKDTLDRMKMSDLWHVASELGISKKGKKDELIARILEKVKENVEGGSETSTTAD